MAKGVKLTFERNLTHDNAVYWAAFSNSGRQLATASLDNTVKLWNPATGEHTGTFKGHGDGVAFVGYLEDGRIVTGSLDRSLIVWSAGGTLLATLTGHQDYLACATVARTGTLVASGGLDKTARLWDAETGSAIARFAGHEGPVQTVAFSPDGKTLASAGDDKSIRLWNVESREAGPVILGHTAAIESVIYSPKERLFVSAGADGFLRFWNLDGTSRDAVATKAERIKSLAFSPDGKLLAVGAGDGGVRIWDVTGRTEVALESAHKNTVYGVAFSPDGKRLASASFDRTIRLWAVERD